MTFSSQEAAAAAQLVDRWAAQLPLTRDLTNNAETASVLDYASEMLASGISPDAFKQRLYGDSQGRHAGPSVLVSAVQSAESKLKLQACGSFHLVCIIAMYGEHHRILPKQRHPNGQDFMRNKVRQLKWLFDGEPEKTWELICVDDGCPHDSKGFARSIIEEEGWRNVQVFDLEDAVGLPFFAERGLTQGCKESRKGGAILYGLHTAGSRPRHEGEPPQLVMYTDSDLSTDMSLCGLLTNGILNVGSAMSMGARYGQAGTFLVKPPEFGPSGHPLSHFEQPNMMKIVFRHYVRVRLLPMLDGIYDTQCAFKCFHAEDIFPVLDKVRSLGSDFDMELLLCALTYFQSQSRHPLCNVSPTLFTEDFAESNFMATSSDPDKPYKTYASQNAALVQMHERYVVPNDPNAAARVVELKKFCSHLRWDDYKRMILKLEKELGRTLIDADLGLERIKRASRRKIQFVDAPDGKFLSPR